MTRSPLLTPVACLCLSAFVAGCGGGGEPPQNPPEVDAVRATMTEQSYESMLKGKTMPNPKGEGTIVLIGDGMYLVKGKKVYAINAAAKGYSSSVPVTKELKESDIPTD